MGNALEKAKAQLNEFYQSLNKSQKIKISLSGSIIIISMVLLFYFTSQPEYVTLYKDLTLKEAGEISTKLDEMGIPWKNGDTPTTILVPKEYYNKANMNLAVEGLPNERFSYEDFLNNSSITMTNEERKKRYLIAQMNSLATTIEAIDGIESAWVDISVAEDTNFLTEKQKSKASVFVELKPGKTLSDQQVDGIVMLVTNAVKDLDPENITVVDNRGLVLNKKTNDNRFDISTQHSLQQQVQKELSNSITQFLSTIYGPGNVAVMVNVKLDFDSEITETQMFSPPIEGEANGLIRSMSDLKEKVVNGAQGGVPGIDSNAQDITQYVETNQDMSTYDKANKTINYELNEINKKIVKAQGQIKDITVAVLINKKSLIEQELSEEHQQKIIDLVSASAGLDTKVVEVMAEDFDTTLAEQFAKAQENKMGSNLLGNIPLWSIGVITALFLGGVGYSFYYFRRRKKEMDDLLKSSAVTEEKHFDEIELELNTKSGYRKQIDSFVDRNPEAVAQLLKTWLNED